MSTFPGSDISFIESSLLGAAQHICDRALMATRQKLVQGTIQCGIQLSINMFNPCVSSTEADCQLNCFLSRHLVFLLLFNKRRLSQWGFYLWPVVSSCSVVGFLSQCQTEHCCLWTTVEWISNISGSGWQHTSCNITCFFQIPTKLENIYFFTFSHSHFTLSIYFCWLLPTRLLSFQSMNEDNFHCVCVVIVVISIRNTVQSLSN